jgi:hypothetical protein
MDKRTFKCFDYDHVWEVEFGIPRPSGCPKCESVNIHRENGKGKRFYRQRRRQRSVNFGKDRS